MSSVIKAVLKTSTNNFIQVHKHIQRGLSSSFVLSQKKMAKNVGESYNFPKEEEKVLELWKDIDAFKTSLKQSEGKPR